MHSRQSFPRYTSPICRDIFTPVICRHYFVHKLTEIVQKATNLQDDRNSIATQDLQEENSECEINTFGWTKSTSQFPKPLRLIQRVSHVLLTKFPASFVSFSLIKTPKIRKKRLEHNKALTTSPVFCIYPTNN